MQLTLNEESKKITFSLHLIIWSWMYIIPVIKSMQKRTELCQIISQIYFIVKCFIKISENNT